MAAAALPALGIWMLLSNEEDKAGKVSALIANSGLALVALGISISLDELAMGFTIGLLHLPIVWAVILHRRPGVPRRTARPSARLAAQRRRTRFRRKDRGPRTNRPRRARPRRDGLLKVVSGTLSLAVTGARTVPYNG